MPSRPLTILQVIPRLESGGVERMAVETAAGAAARGHRVLVASAGGRMEAELVARGGEVARMRLGTRSPTRILANAVRLAGLIRNEKVDLVHAHARAPAWSAYLACRSTGMPFVTTYHGLYRERSIGKRLYNSVMARARAVIVHSRYTADLIAVRYRLPRERVAVIPGGIDLARFAPEAVGEERAAALRALWGVPEDARIVLSLAGPTRGKGPRVLIEAARRVLAARSDVVFVLASDERGRIGHRPNLRSRIRAAGLEGAVHAVGVCDDIAAALALAEAAVVAATEPQAFGLFAVEAQAMGVPPVVTALGAVPETVRAPPRVRAEERTGWHVPPNDPDAMAAALLEALGLDEAARGAIAARARRHARAFRVERTVARTLALYERLA